MFFEWNGNGRKDNSFDNFMDLTMLDQLEEEEQKRKKSNPEKNTGSCLLALIMLPAALIAALFNLRF